MEFAGGRASVVETFGLAAASEWELKPILTGGKI